MRNLVFSLLAIFVITGLLATPANATTKKPWTFMVFLNADNNLEGAGIKDFNEMEQTGSNSNMNVIVQMDRCSGYDYSNGNWTDTRRYYVTKDNDMRTIHSKLLQDMGELNMGDPNVLVNFVKFCADNYPAEHYALVVWNHGGGWKHRNKAQMKVFRGVSYDSTDNDHITMPEMKSAMNSVASYLGQKLDVLDYDACLMGMVEVAYQIKDTVGYLAGSEETEPGDGNPYDLILPTINANTTGAELATIIAKAYQQSYESGYSSTTKAADDLSQMNNVGEAINAVATLMKDNMSTLKPSITSALNNAQKFYDKDYVDFVSLLS
jgi:clostripain